MTLEQGGKRLIRVEDDGGGIAADELPLALASHATSKISDLDELEAVATLGFRGRGAGQHCLGVAAGTGFAHGRGEHGWQVRVRRTVRSGTGTGCRWSRAPAWKCGTCSTTCPARRKFLRADRTEFGHIDELIKRLALGRPEVALQLRHNGKVVRALPAADDAGGRAQAPGQPVRPGVSRACHRD